MGLGQKYLGRLPGLIVPADRLAAKRALESFLVARDQSEHHMYIKPMVRSTVRLPT